MTERQRSEMTTALFALQEQMRDVIAGVEGVVSELKGNGWTDGQARAIVATSFGWRAPTNPESETG